MWYDTFLQFARRLRPVPRRKSLSPSGQPEQIEARLLPTGIIGLWDLTVQSPAPSPTIYQLQLSESWGTSTFQLPGRGTITLSNVTIQEGTFSAKFRQDGIRGTIEGTASQFDSLGQPHLLTLNVVTKGKDGLKLTLTSSVVHELPETNARLKEQVLHELPSLSNLLRKGETLQAAELLLGWAARTGDFALDPSTVGATSNATSVADLYYNYFQPNVAGMSCGGYGNYYSSLLKLFDIDSLDIGFGELPTLTHVTVVIPLREKGEWKFYLMDPTFGMTLKNPETKKPGTFFDLIDSHRTGRLDEVVIETVSLDGRNFLSPVPVSRPDLTHQGVSSGNHVYQWKDYSLFDYLDVWENLLVDSGYTADLKGFVNLMENRVYNALIYGNPTRMTAARNAFLSELAERGIPFGF